MSASASAVASKACPPTPLAHSEDASLVPASSQPHTHHSDPKIEARKYCSTHFKKVMTKSYAATIAAGHLTPNLEEYKEQDGYTVPYYYFAHLHAALRKSVVPHAPPAWLRFMNIHISPLDLSTGMDVAAAVASPASEHAHLQLQRGPRFIRPLAHSVMDDFRRRCNGGNDRRDPSLCNTGAIWDDGTYPPLESDTTSKRSSRSHEMVRTVGFWVEHVPYADPWAPSTFANPKWTTSDTPLERWPRWSRPWKFEPEEGLNMPHLTAGISDMYFWPIDGQLSVAELSHITTCFVARRGRESDFKRTRYVPITVISAGGHLLRVLQAWDDAEEPWKLNIRMSPIMTFKDPLSQDENWKKVVCFVMGDPVIEEQ